MDKNAQTATMNWNPEVFLTRLQEVVGKLHNGEQVAQAAKAAVDGSNPEVKANGLEVVQKAIHDAQAEKKAAFAEGHFGGLQKSFDRLASLSPQFKKLASNAAMDDPSAYLRAKREGSNRYVISDTDLGKMITALMAQPVDPVTGAVKTLDEFRSGSNGVMIESKFDAALRAGSFGGNTNMVAKALDTGSGQVLIRVDLEPMLYEAYLRQFPVEEFIEKVPSNGLQHSYNQVTAMGNAVFIAELGDMSGSIVNSTYVRAQSTPIAIAVSPRSISLKVQFAVEQSGMNYGIVGGADGNYEIVNAMRAIAKKIQTATLQGNSTVPAGVLGDEDGLYDANSFSGFRQQLKLAATSITKGGGQSYRDVIDQAVAQVINAGAQQENLVIFISLGGRRVVNAELETAFLRIDQTLGAQPFDRNLSRGGMMTVADYMTAFMNVPAGSQSEGIGFYTITATDYEDVYVMDPAGLQYAYLGSAMPTILELPIGFNHTLSRVFYPFIMRGLVIRILGFNRKVRIPKQVV